jgi:hypothetical protein
VKLRERWKVRRQNKRRMNEMIQFDIRVMKLDISIPPSLRHVKVSGLFDEHGEWEFQELEACLPLEFVHKIHVIISPPLRDQGDDVVVCISGSVGEYSVAHGYTALCI